MDALTFISKLVESAAWPIAAVIACLVLRKPIENLLGRLNKAQHKDTVLDFNPDIQRLSANIEGSVTIVDAIPQDPLGLIGEAEQRIYTSLEQLNVQSDAEKVKVLAKRKVFAIWECWKALYIVPKPVTTKTSFKCLLHYLSHY